MQTTENAMSKAMQDAGIAMPTIDRETTYFASEQVKRNLAWFCATKFDRSLTLMENIAVPKKGSTPESLAELKTELKAAASIAKWGLNNLNDYMDVDVLIEGWQAGKVGTIKTDKVELMKAALGVNTDTAVQILQAQRENLSNFLVIKRNNKGHALWGHLEKLMDGLEETEPAVENILKACQQALTWAVARQDFTEVYLIKDDCSYHCGEQLQVEVKQDESLALKADAVRRAAAAAQADQAERDRQAIAAFDVTDLLDDDEQAAA